MEAKIPKQLREQFVSFIETHPTQQFSNSLRRMLLDYMAHEVNIGFHIHFDRLLLALYDFFELLDTIEQYRDKMIAPEKE